MNLHIFVLVSYSFGIEFPETIIRSFTPLVSSITIPDPRLKLNGQSLYPFSDQNAAKTIPFGAGTYLYGFMIREHLPGCSRGLVVDTLFCLRTGTVNGLITEGAYQLGWGGGGEYTSVSLRYSLAEINYDLGEYKHFSGSSFVACETSVSVRFRSKEGGTRVKACCGSTQSLARGPKNVFVCIGCQKVLLNRGQVHMLPQVLFPSIFSHSLSNFLVKPCSNVSNSTTCGNSELMVI